MDLRRRKNKPPTQNDSETPKMGASERILKTVTDLYDGGLSGMSAPTFGLKQIADDHLVALPLSVPRQRVTVMVIGNHSAGKSSFINWYTGENIQRTGVAIETKGFSFITSGDCRQTLKGEATLMFYRHLHALESFEGLVPNLFTEVATSKQRQFGCCDFIDTPGLVDGDIHYPYDVDGAIECLSEHTDLILVFFDPIGQALTARTMNVIERVSERHGEKLLFYMSKADQVEAEDDRQRVLIQITQNVTARMKSTHAFKLPTFYLPTAASSPSPPSIPNAINEVCEEIEKAIQLSVQKNLSVLKADCTAIQRRIAQRRASDAGVRGVNAVRRRNGVMLLLGSWAMMPLSLLLLLQILIASSDAIQDAVMAQLVAWGELEGLQRFLGVQPPLHSGAVGWLWRTLVALLCLSFLLSVGSKWVWKALPVMTGREGTQLKGFDAYVEEVLELREELYRDYFRELQSMH